MTQVRLGIYLETKDHVKSHKHDCGIDEACITLQNIEKILPLIECRLSTFSSVSSTSSKFSRLNTHVLFNIIHP